MKTEILIVTFRRDFPYLKWCLESILKFARGFSQLTILVPIGQGHEVRMIDAAPAIHERIMPVAVMEHEEWTDKGMLCHEYQIMKADEWCPASDFILHVDADCIFTEPITPDDYIVNGKPILRYEPFSRIGKRHPGTLVWQECTERCLPFQVLNETMRCHPEVYHRGLYAAAALAIQQKCKQSVEEYLRRQRNEFPQGFCEFVTLGNVAMTVFPDRYELVEQTSDRVSPDNKLQQFWSHGALDVPQSIWVKGEQKTVVPMEMIRHVLSK